MSPNIDTNKIGTLRDMLFAPRKELAETYGKKYGVSKSQIVKTEYIARYLRLAAQNHKTYCRYMPMARMMDLFKSKKLYLSRLSEMNDLVEYKGASEDASRTYLACFSHMRIENLAMWKLYGGSQDESVRLSFPGKVVFKALGGRKRVYKVKPDESCDLKSDILSEVESWSFHDVGYVYGQAICHEHRGQIVGIGRCEALERPYEVKELAAMLKNYGWINEGETRLVIKLKKPIPGLKRIAVDFAEPLEHVEIKVGPIMSKLTKVKKLLEDVSLNVPPERISESHHEVDFGD